MSVDQSEREQEKIPTDDFGLPESAKLALSVAEFGDRTDLSRSLLYEAIKLGDLQSIKIRGRRLILVEDGIAWLRSHRAAPS
jgi:hypothetical protein